MHLVRIDSVSLDEGEAAVDLGQEPGDLVVLSFTDSDLSGIAQAHAAEPGLPSLRLAKLAKLRHPLSVDLHVDRVVARAKVVVIRCLGGLDYWRYGIERCAEAARAQDVVLAVLPGDDRPDPRLAAFSTDPDFAERLDGYFRAGGVDNLRRMLRAAGCQDRLRPRGRATAAAAARVSVVRGLRRYCPSTWRSRRPDPLSRSRCRRMRRWPCSWFTGPPCSAATRRPSWRSPPPCAPAGSACWRWRYRA